MTYSSGYNKDYHATPYGQRGGLSTWVVSGIVSGCTLSLGGTTNNGIQAGAGNEGNAQVVLSSGVLRFDGVTIQVASNITANIPSGVADLTTTDTEVNIFLVPTRKVPVVTAIPSSGTDGDQVLLSNLIDAKDYGTYYLTYRMLKRVNSAWVDLDVYKDIKSGKGWNAMPFNDIVPSVAAANLVTANEVPVFLSTQLPPHIVQPTNCLIRQSAGIYLGTVTYTSGSGVITEGTPDFHKLIS